MSETVPRCGTIYKPYEQLQLSESMDKVVGKLEVYVIWLRTVVSIEI